MQIQIIPSRLFLMMKLMCSQHVYRSDDSHAACHQKANGTPKSNLGNPGWYESQGKVGEMS